MKRNTIRVQFEDEEERFEKKQRRNRREETVKREIRNYKRAWQEHERDFEYIDDFYRR